MDASDPKRLEGPRARSLAMYPWDWHEVRFRDFHVHTTVEKVEKTMVKGCAAGNDLESFFLTDEQKAQGKKTSEPSVERATVTTKAWDERGRAVRVLEAARADPARRRALVRPRLRRAFPRWMRRRPRTFHPPAPFSPP